MRRLALALALVPLAACEPGATADPGLDLLLRVDGAQLVRAAYPDEGDGPAVTAVELSTSVVEPGEGGRSLAGRAAGGTFAIRVGIAGDGGYWTLPVGLPDAAVAGELDFVAACSFAERLRPGPFRILLQAVDARGAGGPITSVPLEARDPTPDGELVVALRWDADADVDLVVVTPDGVVLGPGNPSTYEPPLPGEPPDPPDAADDAGFLDFDSNAGCVLDGRRREHAIWPVPPPPGRYEVRGALAAPPGPPRAAAEVVARLRGEERLRAGGALYPTDARPVVGEGEAMGVLVGGFTVP